MVSEKAALDSFFSACPRRGPSIENWVSTLFLLKRITLLHPRNPQWWKKIKTMEQTVLSVYCLSKLSCNRGMKWWRIFPTSFNATGAYSSNVHFGGTSPFKVQVNFDIPVFEGQIDAEALEKWLTLLEGYFSVHNFYDKEKITFTLLKDLPHVKHWWETSWEQSSTEESGIYGADPTWDFL